MGWLGRICAALLVAWLAYDASPYFALYRLARAVEARDLEAIRHRINGRALRLSLVRQAVNAVLDAPMSRDLDPAQRQLATDAAMTFAEPLVANLVTPEAILDILDDGWPQSLLPERHEPGEGLKLGSLRQLWRVYVNAEGRGFRNLIVAYPPDRPLERQFRIRLRMAGWTWRVVDIELPADLRDRLVREFEAARG